MNTVLSRLIQISSWLLLGLLPLTGWAKEIPLDHITLNQVQAMLPAAQSLGVSAGELPNRAVFDDGSIIGYVFLSDDIAPIPAYSGRPVRILIALDSAARIRGASILRHEEPILVIGITDNDLHNFIAQYLELDARARVRIGAYHRSGYTGVDGITGATITAMVLNSSIMKAAQLVADELHLPLPVAVPTSSTTPAAETAAREAAASTVPAAPTAVRSTASIAAPGPVLAAPSTLPPEVPLWVEIWQQQKLQLGILSIALLLLMTVLFFQDWLVVRPRLFKRVRIGYLLFTVFFLGFFCKAQLSVINVVAFMRVMFGGFTWETLLIDPVIFVLWGFVAVSIILWGRGVFCGWLCPFGAAQELIHKISERYKWPTWEFPPMVHERLWAIKYFILIALVGLSLESMEYAARLTEIEPFKTVFVLRFNRELIFVAWAVLLLTVALFNSKFYCKYLCPLGAALSFFTRFRIFDWLRRRKECGKPCQTCAAQCQISAIKPTGEIIDNECHYCLECQVTYWDDHRCPPLVEKRKRKEGRDQRGKVVIASDHSGA